MNTINSPLKLPPIGFGTWQLSPEEAEISVRNALEVGYRFIDTAQIYKNEEGVGKAITSSKVPRKEIILATKVWISNLNKKHLKKSVEESLTKLETDYVDILYIHWPSGKYKPKETLPLMDQMVEERKAKYIAVSNFTPRLLDEAIRIVKTPIIANQIETHPFLPQKYLREKLVNLNMYLIAYSPIARGQVLKHPILNELALKYNADPAQITLAWHIAHGHIPIPKSKSFEHIRANYQALDITLKPEDIEKIDLLDNNHRLINVPFLRPKWGEI